MRKSLIIILITIIFVFSVFAGISKTTEDIKGFWKKGKNLYEEGKYKQFFNLIDQGLIKYPKHRLKITKSKYTVLLELKKYKKALKAALEIDKLDPKKLRSTCLKIARIYIMLKDFDNAFKWIRASVDRGYQYYKDFEQNFWYYSIRNDPRMKGIISRIKDNVGIDKPVKNINGITISGEKISLKDYKNKVILIDFWAVWCSGCVKSIPELKEFYLKFKDQGFDIIGVNLDKDKQRVIDFLKKNKLEWKTIFSGNGFQDKTVKQFKINSIPSTWLIDKKGNLRYFGLRGFELKNKIIELINE